MAVGTWASGQQPWIVLTVIDPRALDDASAIWNEASYQLVAGSQRWRAIVPPITSGAMHTSFQSVSVTGQ